MILPIAIFSLLFISIFIGVIIQEAKAAFPPCQVNQGCTGWNAIQANTVMYGNGSSDIATSTGNTDGYVLALVNGKPTFVSTSTITADPNVIISGGFLQASTTGTWVFPSGFISQASSTITATTTFVSDITIGTSTPYTASMVNVEIQNPAQHGVIIQSAANQDAHLFMIRNNAGVILMDVLASGEVDIFHTATGNNEIGLELDVDAVTHAGIIPLFINFDVGALADGEDETGIEININRFDSTGGDIHGVECDASTGSAEVHCLKITAGVNVIEQFSGTFGNMNAASSTAGGAGFIDSATSTILDATMFASDNDVVVIGDTSKFEEIEFVLDTPASGAGIKPTFAFSTACGSFTSFTPTDGTNGMRNDTGEITWEDADIPSWAAGCGGNFEIEITRTQNGLSTAPIENIIQISAVTIYSWDLNADLKMSNLWASSTVQATGNIIGYANLGIATTTPDSALSIQGNALISGNLIGANLTATGTLAVTGATTLLSTLNISADTFILDNAGLIIGTNSQLSFAEATPELQMQGLGFDDTSFGIALFSSGDSTFPSYVFMKSAGVGFDTNVLVADNESLGGILAYAADGTDYDTLVADIHFQVDDSSPAEGAIGGRILLETSDTSGNLLTAISINNSQMSTLVGGFISQASSSISSSLHVSGLLQASSTLTAKDVTISNSLAIPATDDPTISVTSNLAIDNKAATNSVVWFDGTAERIIYATTTSKMVVNLPADLSGKDFSWQEDYRIEILGMFCIVDPSDTTGVDIDIEFFEGNTTGDSTTTLDAIITCDNDGARDDGTLTDSIIEAKNFLGVHIGTASGTPSTLTIQYRWRYANP